MLDQFLPLSRGQRVEGIGADRRQIGGVVAYTNASLPLYTIKVVFGISTIYLYFS